MTLFEVALQVDQTLYYVVDAESAEGAEMNAVDYFYSGEEPEKRAVKRCFPSSVGEVRG